MIRMLWFVVVVAALAVSQVSKAEFPDSWWHEDRHFNVGAFLWPNARITLEDGSYVWCWDRYVITFDDSDLRLLAAEGFTLRLLQMSEQEIQAARMACGGEHSE